MVAQREMKQYKPWKLLIACSLVLVVGGVIVFLVPRKPSEREAYDRAVSFLRMVYAGPTKFDVSAFGVEETRVDCSGEGCLVSGVFASDKADLDRYRAQSIDGRFAFSVEVKRVQGYIGFGGFSASTLVVGPNR